MMSCVPFIGCLRCWPLISRVLRALQSIVPICHLVPHAQHAVKTTRFLTEVEVHKDNTDIGMQTHSSHGGGDSHVCLAIWRHETDHYDSSAAPHVQTRFRTDKAYLQHKAAYYRLKVLRSKSDFSQSCSMLARHL